MSNKLNLTSFTPDDFAKSAKMTVTDGRLSLTKAAIKLADLKTGDKIFVHQDNTDFSTWYISKEENGFPLQSKDSRLIMYHADLCKTILHAFGEKSITLEFDEEPIKQDGKQYWRLTVI